jgi:hypothetical protein
METANGEVVRETVVSPSVFLLLFLALPHVKFAFIPDVCVGNHLGVEYGRICELN